MAITVVASVSAGSVNGETVTTGAIDTTGATGIVIAVGDFESATSSPVSDNKGGAVYTALTRRGTGVGATVRLHYCAAPTVGSGHTFTAGTGGTGSFPSIAVLALSGTDTATFYDGSENGASGTNVDSLQPGSVTPSLDNEILITAVAINNLGTGQTVSGYTVPELVTYLAANHFGVAIAYLIQTSAAAANPTWTWTTQDNTAAAIAPFRAGVGGGGTPFFTRLDAVRLR